MKAKKYLSEHEEIPAVRDFMGMTLGKTFYEGLANYDIYEVIKPFNKDVLIIHGDHDTLVQLSYSERALQVYSLAELKVIEGVGHGFHGAEEDMTIKYITDFFNMR